MPEKLLDPPRGAARSRAPADAQGSGVVEQEARGLGRGDRSPAEDPGVSEGGLPDHHVGTARLLAHSLQVGVGVDAAVAADGDLDRLDRARDARPVHGWSVVLRPGPTVDRQECGAAGLCCAGQDLHVVGVVVARADLGRHRHGSTHAAHHGLDRLLHASGVLEGRRAGAATKGTLRGAAEVQVDQRSARADGGGGGLLEGREVGAHELQPDRGAEAALSEVLQQDPARHGVVDHPHELGEGPSEVLGRVALEHQLTEAGLGDALHGGEQPGAGERERVSHGESVGDGRAGEVVEGCGGYSLLMFETIDSAAAAARLEGVVERTPLVPFESPDPRIELRLKLENRQETGSFKSRGAWNNVCQLTPEERAAGVIATSSGNHGRALAWAAQRAGVHATIVMPEDAYPNKIAACRDLGAEVLLGTTRTEAERICRERVEAGAVLIHPYDAERTVEGAGTVGLELAQQWPEVEVVVLPVGGGGLISGSSLALRRSLGSGPRIFGVEPAGAPSMTRGIAAGAPVLIDPITTEVQGLCPLESGRLNIAICSETLDGVFLVEDPEVFAVQRQLVQAGVVVEPAGAAAPAWVLSGHLPRELLAGRDATNPLRVAVVVSGGNPAPDQLEELRRS